MTIRKFTEYTPEIASSAYVDEAAFVSGRTTIGENSSVWPMAVLRGDVNFIQIGKRTNIQDGAVLHVTHANPESTFSTGSPLILVIMLPWATTPPYMLAPLKIIV